MDLYLKRQSIMYTARVNCTWYSSMFNPRFIFNSTHKVKYICIPSIFYLTQCTQIARAKLWMSVPFTLFFFVCLHFVLRFSKYMSVILHRSDYLWNKNFKKSIERNLSHGYGKITFLPGRKTKFLNFYYSNSSRKWSVFIHFPTFRVGVRVGVWYSCSRRKMF